MAAALEKWAGALQAVLAGETIAQYLERTQLENGNAVKGAE